MIDSELIKILCCPETHQSLTAAEPSLIEELNRQIATGKLRNRAGALLTEQIEGGLVRDDGKLLYPIRNRLPILLVDEAISLTAAS